MRNVLLGTATAAMVGWMAIASVPVAHAQSHDCDAKFDEAYRIADRERDRCYDSWWVFFFGGGDSCEMMFDSAYYRARSEYNRCLDAERQQAIQNQIRCGTGAVSC
jgi:hypothetical protein